MVTGVHSLMGLIPLLTRVSYGTSLIVGNVDESTASWFVRTVEKAIPFEPLPITERSVKRAYEVPKAKDLGGDYRGILLRNQEPNKNDANSAVNFYFQLPSRDPHEYLLIELLADLLEQPFYNSLRTQQQLGYIVSSGVKSRQGLYSLVLTVQSSIVSGDDLIKRIDLFLHQFISDISDLSSDKFQEFVTGLQTRKSEPDRRLTSQASRLWQEIIFNENLMVCGVQKKGSLPFFDRYEREVEILSSIRIEDFKKFSTDLLTVNRRLVVSEVIADKFIKENIEEEPTSRFYRILDVPTFTSSLKTI
jgi:secreted Zn-dependent insulinase-like peptidase